MGTRPRQTAPWRNLSRRCARDRWPRQGRPRRRKSPGQRCFRRLPVSARADAQGPALPGDLSQWRSARASSRASAAIFRRRPGSLRAMRHSCTLFARRNRAGRWYWRLPICPPRCRSMRCCRALTDLACYRHPLCRYRRLPAAHCSADGQAQAFLRLQPRNGSPAMWFWPWGKQGARELNFSSDIDLVVFFDPEASSIAPDTEPATLFVRLTKRLVALLQEVTERRLRLPRRSALAARSARHPDRHLDRGGGRLLRKHGSELGARRHDQGSAGRRRSEYLAGNSFIGWRLMSGAAISISPPSPTCNR